MPGEMAARIIALALLCFVTPNPGLGSRGTSLVVPQRQTFASTYSKVAPSKVEAAVASTSVIRTSPVTAVSAKPPVYIGENGVASRNSSSVTETPVPTIKSTYLSTKALSPSAVNLFYVNVSSTKPETLTPVTAASTTRSLSVFTETSAFEPLPLSATKTQSYAVLVTVSSHRISGNPHISESPTSSPPTPSRRPVDYKLILCVAVPLFAVLVFVIVIAMVLCIRRYRKLRRYRQHLVPLTDMDGSDDSDEDEQIGDKEPVFMVSTVNSSARPILSFENEND